MKTRIYRSFLGFGAVALLATPSLVGVAKAQESLAGLGAASGIGATLGAGAAGSAFNTPRVPRGTGANNQLIDEAGNAGGVGGATTQTTVQVTTAPVSTAPEPQLYGMNVKKTVRELRVTPSITTPKGGLPRRAESKVARQRRLARLSPTARKKAIQRTYKIPPRGWLSQYLPQDRYKFGQDWKFVSTEDSRYYFKPQALALRKFNPNRVIGFHTWQDAMLAGYKPDPLSKPEPAPKILSLGNQTRGDNYYRFVGYVYSGQVNPSIFEATYQYSNKVAARLRTHPDAKRQVSRTIDTILAASVNGDLASIPVAVGKTLIYQITTATGADGAMAGTPQFPGMPNAGINQMGGPGGAPVPPMNMTPPMNPMANVPPSP